MKDSGTYKFYAMNHSYYSGKVRPYLRYKGIPYKEVLTTLWVYQRFIIPRTGVRFIPVLQSPDDIVVQDTTEIIDFLEERFPERPVYPSTPKQRLVALLFELYADEWFLLPAMHYRWSYMPHHEKWLMGEFGRVGGNWLPAPLRRVIGRRVSKPFKGFLPALGINESTAPAIEERYGEFLAHFNAHLDRHPYLLGSRPSIGDFALAGPLYAHLWLDPYPHRIMEENAPNVVDWIKRINASEQPGGAFLPIDEVPTSLYPMLRHMFEEHFPILADTAKRLPAWLDGHPQKEYISRAIGEHEFTIGDVTGRRLVFPYSLWMLQRPLDFYRRLDGERKADVDALLDQAGGLEAMQMDIPRRVERCNNRLVAAV